MLFDVALDIPPGALVVLMGASCSSKTTLLTLLGCLREVQEGSVRVLGTKLNAASEQSIVALRRRFGFIFQSHNLHESLTAQQNVRMGLDMHGPAPGVDDAVAHVLHLLGLGERLDYKPGRLSGGQKQRVAVARALVGIPAVVFADEPTAALDKASGFEAVALLRRLARQRGTTMLMVTHDNRILGVADWIIVIEDGRVSRRAPEKVGSRFAPLLQSVSQNRFSVATSLGRSAASRQVFRPHLGTSRGFASPGARLSPGLSLLTLGLARSSLQAPTLCSA